MLYAGKYKYEYIATFMVGARCEFGSAIEEMLIHYHKTGYLHDTVYRHACAIAMVDKSRRSFKNEDLTLFPAGEN